MSEAAANTAEHDAIATAQPPPEAPASQTSASPALHENARAFMSNSDARLSAIPPLTPTFHIRKPSAAGLHLETHPDATDDTAIPAPQHHGRSSQDGGESLSRQSSLSRAHALYARPSTEQMRASSYTMSPPSSVPSPMLHALKDVTPLPSPISATSDAWHRQFVARSRGNSAASAASVAREEAVGLLPPSILGSPPRKKKQYHLTGPPSEEGMPLRQEELRQEGHGHTRNRSISEFKPETLHNIRPRNITTPHGGSVPPEVDTLAGSSEHPLHREQNFAHRNKSGRAELSAPSALPSPPPSSKDAAEGEEIDSIAREIGPLTIRVGSKRRRWRPLRQLGQGAFSRVVLAAGEHGETEQDDEMEIPPLVAIKIQAHDCTARDEGRMEASIEREVEMLRKVNHPNLPQLMGFEDDSKRALVVLNYCAGGDLFELASQRRDLLTPAMIQRIFSELVDATLYLHENWIVHRDIKLENILINMPVEELATLEDPRQIGQAVITLTDLGLSRQIPQPPEDPLLQHPCGSPDYAAPEILLGQRYDGRATDAWALGVLLYALMEGRLPFDAPPGKRVTGNVKHRIARCDWLWCEYGDRFGEWVPEKGREVEGAREIVEGLLVKRGRWGLERVKQHPFCAEGTQVPGRLKRSYTAQF